MYLIRNLPFFHFFYHQGLTGKAETETVYACRFVSELGRKVVQSSLKQKGGN